MALFSKKHYTWLADHLRDTRGYCVDLEKIAKDSQAKTWQTARIDAIDLTIRELASAFKVDNAAFDEDQFRTACGELKP